MMENKKKNSPAALDKRPLGIYLHIPFCVKKCLYCDFLSMPATDETIEAYVEALCGQIRLEAPGFVDYRVNTVFLGGGTPSLLSGEQLEKIFKTLFAAFEVEKGAEITMESNPGTLTAQKLESYKKAGVNRLSMGLQSSEDELLKSLGRIHTWSEFLENFQAARAAGFSNINVDLMSALPGQTLSEWMRTLKKVADLEPEHISAYSLIIEEGTPFYERYGDEKETDLYPALPDEEEERQMYTQTKEFLESRGYHRYEISNYAKEGRECCHNVGNWNRTEYLGFGIGAASLVDNCRFRVIEELPVYLETLEKLQDTGEKQALWEALHEPVQRLSRQEQMEEFMFLGLRLTEGIRTDNFDRQFGQDIWEI